MGGHSRVQSCPPRQRVDKMVLQQLVIAVRVVNRHQALVDNEEVHPLPVNVLPLHHLKDLRDISTARHRHIHLFLRGKSLPELFAKVPCCPVQQQILVLFFDCCEHSFPLYVKCMNIQPQSPPGAALSPRYEINREGQGGTAPSFSVN